MIPHHSPNTERLISYIAAGVTQSQAAAALGITPSAVSQLLDSPEVSARVAELREKQITRATALDQKYDELEDTLLDQLKRTAPLLMRPGEIANVLARVNAAKRRGVGASQSSAPTQVIQLNLPVAIQNRFVLDAQNKVVAAGAQDLVTIPSTSVTKLLEVQNAHKEDEFGFTTDSPGQGSSSTVTASVDPKVLSINTSTAD